MVPFTRRAFLTLIAVAKLNSSDPSQGVGLADRDNLGPVRLCSHRSRPRALVTRDQGLAWCIVSRKLPQPQPHTLQRIISLRRNHLAIRLHLHRQRSLAECSHLAIRCRLVSKLG